MDEQAFCFGLSAWPWLNPNRPQALFLEKFVLYGKKDFRSAISAKSTLKMLNFTLGQISMLNCVIQFSASLLK
jgi:hypothetical protein